MANQIIDTGNAVLGIEFGSTRIKAVLIGPDHSVISSGSYEWENEYVNGIWTYSADAILTGLKSCYADLKKNVADQFGTTIKKLRSIGISAMMHGYLAFDRDMNMLVPFRTWRNTITGEAAAQLTELFNFNMPQRWSLSHLYQAVLNKEEHLSRIDFMTTLAGWVHCLLTDEKVIGIGDASGIMPIDSLNPDYDAGMVSKFENKVKEYGFNWNLKEMLPRVLVAGEKAGCLTKQGSLLLDADGDLEPGIPLCPPEGDAGTGMTATNSVRERTGNVSAGTSIFSMVVLSKPLSRVYEAIDIVTTPSGKPVAMVHCNSCTSDINAWVGLFREFANLFGVRIDSGDLYTGLFKEAMKGDRDCGGLVNFNYYAGEPVTEIYEGRPLFVRMPDAKFSLANFMRVQIYAAMETLKYGMDIMNRENVAIDRIYGHGGLFKTKGVAQNLLSAAIKAPVTVMETAGEGGAWGIALLAQYMTDRNDGETLEDYLQDRVFGKMNQLTVEPDPDDIEGFDRYMESFVKCIPVQKAAIENFK